MTVHHNIPTFPDKQGVVCFLFNCVLETQFEIIVRGFHKWLEGGIGLSGKLLSEFATLTKGGGAGRLLAFKACCFEAVHYYFRSCKDGFDFLSRLGQV
jgi:hypothetical protein